MSQQGGDVFIDDVANGVLLLEGVQEGVGICAYFFSSRANIARCFLGQVFKPFASW